MSVRSLVTEASVVFLVGSVEKALLVAGTGRSRPHPRQMQIFLVG